MAKLFLYISLSVIGGILIVSIHDETTLKEYGIHILAVGSIFCLEAMFENWRYLWLLLKAKSIYRRKMIRLSISYLYQIKIDGKYLLVKGHRIENQFQPVGGVFKRLRESFYALQKLGVLDDDNVPIDDCSIDDLRVKVPGKNLVKFIEWYETQLGREVSPHREFHEELIRTDILSNRDFPYPNYLHLERKQTPIRFSHHFQCYEVLIAEIFKLMPTEAQCVLLRDLIGATSEKYIWADEATIIRRGANIGITISETSSWIL